jgi:hypothetical protein
VSVHAFDSPTIQALTKVVVAKESFSWLLNATQYARGLAMVSLETSYQCTSHGHELRRVSLRLHENEISNDIFECLRLSRERGATVPPGRHQLIEHVESSDNRH